MKEGPPKNIIEEGPEKIPTPEEVEDVFKMLIEAEKDSVDIEKFETIRKFEDEKGLYLWEIKSPIKNGEYAEYSYMRARPYDKEVGGADRTAIDVAFYDESDVLIGGDSVAKYIDGEWKLTP